MSLCSPSGVNVEGTSFDGGKRRSRLTGKPCTPKTFDCPVAPFSSNTTNLLQFFLSSSKRVKTRTSEALETRYCLLIVTYCSETTHLQSAAGPAYRTYSTHTRTLTLSYPSKPSSNSRRTLLQQPPNSFNLQPPSNLDLRDPSWVKPFPSPLSKRYVSLARHKTSCPVSPAYKFANAAPVYLVNTQNLIILLLYMLVPAYRQEKLL